MKLTVRWGCLPNRTFSSIPLLERAFNHEIFLTSLKPKSPFRECPFFCFMIDACGALHAFRGANGEKDAFRRDPSSPQVAHLRWIPTKRGTKLLTSGWWGLARKINYTGDWIMGLSWCLFTGFGSLVPYFYSIYFGILLVHRAGRDDHACAAKYGADWAIYKRKVPSLFVPGVY